MNIHQALCMNLTILKNEIFNTFKKSAKFNMILISYKEDCLVATKRTQFKTGVKVRSYRIKTVKPNVRYEIGKVGQQDGSHLTSTAIDFIKKWSTNEA
ncbi:hypothetical protein CDAR_29121 [Caerostris darwini]|uniref:Uncharacterized protein n=1 Tax=Caerostris darwini TaxID=1538125 RepID=A0AAV4V4I6_9ARAC|nr:hypothetical protein CDAR_29121 [Caerostris darwini]